MATARTHHHVAVGTGYGAYADSGSGGQSHERKRVRNKLRKDADTGSVLPPPSEWSRGPIVYGHATTYGGVGQTGYQSPGAAAPYSSSIATTTTSYGAGMGYRGGAAGSSYGTTAPSMGGRTFSMKGGTYGQGTPASGQLQQKIEEAKEKNRQRRERNHVKRRPDELLHRNLPVDEAGIAHDADYMQNRGSAARPVSRRPPPIPETPDNDDSASSSSSCSSSSGASGFASAPYTYQSTHRTTASSTHAVSGVPRDDRYPSAMSAVPSYLSNGQRRSTDAGPSRSASSHHHHRRPTSPSLHDGSSGHYSAYDRIGPGYGSRVTSSRLRSVTSPHATTASYQPPAPAAYNPRDPVGSSAATGGTSTTSDGGGGGGGAHNGAYSTTVGASSLVGSTARLSLNDSSGGPNESGYNKAVKAGHVSSTRPPKMDGTALDAGMHGLTRSWDGFKLDMRFGAHKVGKKVSRKLNSGIL